MKTAPPIKLACCLLGIAAAGAPLLWFTQPGAPEPQASAAPRQREAVEVDALVRWSAAPSVIRISHEGAEVCTLAPDGSAAQWSGKLLLPAPAVGELELEVEAEWPGAPAEAQAITLELLPPKLPARRDTQWADPGERMMHQLFIFPW